MSERWWRRRKRRHLWFSDFFEESDRLEKMMDEMMPQSFRSLEKRKHRKPYVFVFSVTFEPDSSPRFRRFENSQSSYYGAELPRVKREDVQIHATQCNLTISVDAMEHKYYK